VVPNKVWWQFTHADVARHNFWTEGVEEDVELFEANEVEGSVHRLVEFVVGLMMGT